MCFFSAQLSGNFLKTASFFSKKSVFFFPNFCVSSLKFEKVLFLDLLKLKYYKSRGFSNVCVFVVERPPKLLELCQTHQKQTTITLKTSKKQTQKTPLCHVQKQPTSFHKFSVFFQHTIFAFEKLCFAENTIKIVFSEKHSFSKTQLVKPTFSPMSKNTFFKENLSFLVLGNFR